MSCSAMVTSSSSSLVSIAFAAATTPSSSAVSTQRNLAISRGPRILLHQFVIAHQPRRPVEITRRLGLGKVADYALSSPLVRAIPHSTDQRLNNLVLVET